MSYRYDVFISYSHVNQEWVCSELLPRLEAAGLKVCIDYRDFEIGAPSLTNMESAVENSRHTLLVLTPAWVNSEWTNFESLLVGVADPAGRKRRLLPLMLEPCQPPVRISILTHADLTRFEGRADQFDRLLEQIQSDSKTVRQPLNALAQFIAGPPITHPRRFFGRERELKRIFNLLKNPPLQNAAIIGPRRSGKTSLLLHLKNIVAPPPTQLRHGQRSDWVPEPERYRWVFVDFQDPRVGGREDLLRRILRSLDLPEPNPCDLDHFINVVAQRLRAPTVILLDEIGVALQRYPELDDTFWEGLRALSTHQVADNLAFVLAAHEPPDQLAAHSNHSSPFFNIFGYTATLGPLTEAEARALIDSSPAPFPDADVEWILAESGRWPILLQILCRERLVALEDGEADDAWREEGQLQMAPFRHLLEGQ